jgi:ribonuclease HII
MRIEDKYLTGSTFKLEEKLKCDGYDVIIGIDEAGRGPLAGPVTAAAVALRKFQIPNFKSQINFKLQIPNSKFFSLIRDSKTLSEKQRESLYDFILENFYVGIGISNHATVDRMNILQATFLAMRKALSNLHSKMRNNIQNNKQKISNFQFPISNKFSMNNFLIFKKVIILVDGNKEIPNVSIEQKAIINGDKTVKSISAASVVAKVTRDRIMRRMHKLYPQYFFDQHKGYGTRLHMECLKKHGPCEIHRRSFRPVAENSK